MASNPSLAFLDAAVLASPVTRTLLIARGDPAGLAVTWSQYAEEQANRHLPPQATSLTSVRERILSRTLGPTGTRPERFAHTQVSDRQILADAEAAGAAFLITSDVDDFAEIDLVKTSISAVNPDLFMAIRFPQGAYLYALRQLVSNMHNPPRSEAEMHALLANRHPRLFARHANVYEVPPARSAHREPKTLFRGSRCVRCGAVVPDPQSLTLGVEGHCELPT